MQNLPFLISGGGIGGLSLALALAKKGFSVKLLERASAFGEIGAGIQLGPNAFHAFDYLGVGEEMKKNAVFIDALRLMDAITGEDITTIPLDEPFRAHFKNPYAVVHRGEMLSVLLKSCQASEHIELLNSCEVIGYQQDEKSVVALLKSGEKITGKALIGADGLWSKIREQLVGDGFPRVSGHTTYRSVIPTEQMPQDLRWNAATLWAGPKCHIVHYPLSGWKSFNLVVTYHNSAPEPHAGKSVTHEEVLKGFQHVCPKARSIIEHGTDWKSWVLCDREPLTNWSDGRVTLLGDAAHPTLQYMAQGACMAMEDAVCLSHELAHIADVEKAFLQYQAKRMNRTARVVIQSRLVGDHIYHPAGGHAALRNGIMRALSPNEYYDRLNWLYGADVQKLSKV